MDGFGNLLCFLLYRGNRNTICLAKELMESFDLNERLVLDDKGYDSDKFVRWVEPQVWML